MEGSSNTSLLIKKFSRYKVGVTFFWILIVFYIVIILGGFISPYTAGTPYQGEAAQGGQARELYTYYKSKTMHPPTPINFEMGENGLRAFTKEYKRLEKPGYNTFIELGVEKSIGEIIDFIKLEAIESIIDNYPIEEKQKEIEVKYEIEDGVYETETEIETYNYPTYLIDLSNKLSKENKPIFIKLVNSSQNQKQHIAELIINTIEEDLIQKSAKKVISSNFTYNDFKSIISGLIEEKNYTEEQLKIIYKSDFPIEVVHEIIRQKQGMVLDVILREMGIGGISANINVEQLLTLFDSMIKNIDTHLKKEIIVQTKTYKMVDDKIGFEGNIEYLEKLLNEYDSLNDEIKEAQYFEENLENYPNIIKEAIVKYLELEVPDMTLSSYYSALRNTDYFKNLPSEVIKEFKNTWLRDANIKPFKGELYKEIRDQLPPEFAKIINNSPTYLNTTLSGFIQKTPYYVTKSMLKEIIEKEVPENILKKQYIEVKKQLPPEMVELIEEFRNTDLTVKDLLRYVIDRKIIEKLPQEDFTSVNSIDALQDMVVNEELLKEEMPPSVEELFRKYIDFSDKTVEEILELIPHVCDNENIPTRGRIVVKKYLKLLEANLNMPVFDVFRNNNEYLTKYLKSYIKQERLQFEHDLKFFVEGEDYTLFWVFKTNIHLFGTVDKGTFYLMGADEQGRDILSRIIYGGSISMSVGFLGVFLSLSLSIIIGGVAGYFGGMVDWLVMRICEIVLLFPSFYLLLTLRGILPTDMSPEQRFILIIVILSFMFWAGGARVIRGFILSGKNQDFVIAAKIAGIPTYLVILKHLLPQISSYLIVRVSIGIPGYIIYETSLSWLGFGISEPSVSWGLMLSIMRELSIISVATDYPWLLWPAAVVVLAVMCYQIIGDAIRDTLDPMVKR